MTTCINILQITTEPWNDNSISPWEASVPAFRCRRTEASNIYFSATQKSWFCFALFPSYQTHSGFLYLSNLAFWPRSPLILSGCSLDEWSRVKWNRDKKSCGVKQAQAKGKKVESVMLHPSDTHHSAAKRGSICVVIPHTRYELLE